MRLTPLLAPAWLAAVSCGIASAQTAVAVSAGYAVELDELQSHLVRVGQLSNGERLQAGPRELRRYGADGVLLDTILVYADHPDLAELQDVETLAISPDETTVAVGVFATALGQALVCVSIADGSVQVFPLPLVNWRPYFDWRDPHRIYFSALGDLGVIAYWEIDTQTAATRLVGTLASDCPLTGGGSIAFDDQGNLYGATYCFAFGLADPRGSVLRVDAAFLDQATPFTTDDANEIYMDVEEEHLSLAIDSAGNRLFAYDRTYDRLIQIDIPTATRTVLADNPTPDLEFKFLEFTPGPVGAFGPYQPETTGRIRADNWHFSTSEFFVERVRIVPERPTLAVTPNPPPAPPNEFTRAIQNGPPNGIGVLFVGPASMLIHPEPTYLLGGLSLFFALNPVSAHLAGVPFTLDAFGAHTLTFDDPGTVPFLRAGQAVFFDASLQIVGSSTVEFL